MFNLKGPQGQNPRTTCGPRTSLRNAALEDHNIDIHYCENSRITYQHNLVCVNSHFSTAWNQPPPSNTVRYYWNPNCVIFPVS